MTGKSKLSIVKEILKGTDWKVSNSQEGLKITTTTKAYSAKLGFRTFLSRRDSKLVISVKCNIHVDSIEFIYRKFVKHNPGYTALLIAPEVQIPLKELSSEVQLKDVDKQYSKEIMSSWYAQFYEYIIPSLNRFDNLGDLNIFQEESSVSGKPVIRDKEKQLILKKLVADKAYEILKTERGKFLKNADPNKIIDRFRMINPIENFKLIIPFLDSLNVDNYLESMPWPKVDKKSVIKVERIDPIILHRTTMIVIAPALSTGQVAQCLGYDTMDKVKRITAGEASQMSFGDEGVVDILEWDSSIIGFLQDTLLYDSFDLRKASINGSAFRFVSDETSMSFRYEYYKNGIPQSRHMEINGEVVEERHSDSFDVKATGIEDMIHTLFYKVSGRELMKIDINEKVERWKLKK